MKFKQLGTQIIKRSESENCFPAISQQQDDKIKKYLKKSSPIMSAQQAKYFQTMKKQIKNSFPDKLSILKNHVTLYKYEENDNVLKAKSHLYNIPSLTTPQLAYQIAQKIKEQTGVMQEEIDKHNMFQQLSHNKIPQKFSKAEQKFKYRNGLKQLENWLKKKLNTPPITQTQCFEYKNTIMNLGIKQIVRIIKLRCEQEGNLVEQIWNMTWKICQDIILYLSKELTSKRKIFDTEMDKIQILYVKKINEINKDTHSLLDKISNLQKDKIQIQTQFKNLNRINKELKLQVNQERQNAQHFEKEYMSVLQENLKLQMNDLDKREWIKKLYKSIKVYKARIAKKFQKNIKGVAINNSTEDQLLDIDNLDFNKLDQNQSMILQQEDISKQFLPKSVQIQTQKQTGIHIQSQTDNKIYVNWKTNTDVISKQQIGVETIEVKSNKFVQQTSREFKDQSKKQKPEIKEKQRQEKYQKVPQQTSRSKTRKQTKIQKKLTHLSKPSLQDNLNEQQSKTKMQQIKEKQVDQINNFNKILTQSSEESLNKADWNVPLDKNLNPSKSSTNQNIQNLQKIDLLKLKKTNTLTPKGLVSPSRTPPTYQSTKDLESLSLRNNMKQDYIKQAEELKPHENFDQSYKKMKRVLFFNKNNFRSSILHRRSLVNVKILEQNEEAPQELNYGDSIITKLKKYNFTFLNKIKNNKNQTNLYKQLLKNFNQLPLLTEKKMESIIQKNLLPVLIELIKYYRKLVSTSSITNITQFHRNLLSLPVVVIKKFTQKYGVKNLALKHLKQVLRYVSALRNKSLRGEIVYKLFPQSNRISSDDLSLYLNLEARLDPMLSGLSSREENYKIYNKAQIDIQLIRQICEPYFQINDRQFFTYTQDSININQIIHQIFMKFLDLKTQKLNKLGFLYDILSNGNGLLRIQRLADFVISLNFKSEVELQILKQIFYFCDNKTLFTKFEISKERFNSFLIRSKLFTYDNIYRQIQCYSKLYTDQINQHNIRKLQNNQNSKLLIYVQQQAILQVATIDQPNINLIWKYLQYLEFFYRTEKLYVDILGQLDCLSYKKILVNSTDKRLFQINI